MLRRGYLYWVSLDKRRPVLLLSWRIDPAFLRSCVGPRLRAERMCDAR
jgi:hypothetical protein